MEKYLITIFVSICLATTLKAQQNSLIWGDTFDQTINLPYNTEDSYYDCTARFLGAETQTNATFWMNKRNINRVSNDGKFILTRLDATNKLIFSKDLQLLDFPEKNESVFLSIEEIVMLEDKFVVLLRVYNKKIGVYAFYLHEITFDGNLTARSVKVTELKYKFNLVENDIILSPDKASILVSIKKDIFEDHYYALLVVNTDLSIIYYKELRNKITNSKNIQESECMLYSPISNVKVSIDNAHRVFFLASNLLLKNRRLATVLFWYSPQQDEFKEMVLDLGENIEIDASVIRMNASGSCMIYGFYRHIDNNTMQLAGSFSLSPDLDSDTFILKQKEITFGKGSAIPLLTCIAKEDGGIFLFYEHMIYGSKDEHGSKGELYIVSYNKDSEIEYQTVVYKKQKVFYAMGGYVALYDPLSDKLSIIFNDLRENAYINHPKAESLYKQQDAVPVIACIDSAGNVKKKLLLDRKNISGTFLCPFMATQCAVNAVEIWGYEDKKKYRVGKLVIAE